jgi:prepilin-type N-terminal cleavage/methylation domain-containing protein
MRPRRRSAGFTLVELLVVIAIIGILAAFLAVSLPKAMELAKMSALKNNFNQIRTILTAYYTDHGSFPPAYGYLSPVFLKEPYQNPATRSTAIIDALNSGALTEAQAFFLLPWMSHLREHGNQDLYDNFSHGQGSDTDADGVISRLEFAPRGVYNGGSQTYEFNYAQLYLGDDGTSNTDSATTNDVAEQSASQDPRPFLYLPVNERQFRLFRKIIYDFAGRQGNQSNPRPFNLDGTAISQINTQLSFPPPSYDAFVLISVGPQFNIGTSGLVVEFGPDTLNLADFPSVYQYHILALATYFLATRDAENNGKGDGELDFDFTARKSRGQAGNGDNDLPGAYPKASGPVIFVGGV